VRKMNYLKLSFLSLSLCVFISLNIGVYDEPGVDIKELTPTSSPYIDEIMALIEKMKIAVHIDNLERINDKKLLNELIEKNNLWFEEDYKQINSDKLIPLITIEKNITALFWLSFFLILVLASVLNILSRFIDFTIVAIMPLIFFITGFFSLFQFSTAIVLMLFITIIGVFREKLMGHPD
jgi:hypothetical protein